MKKALFLGLLGTFSLIAGVVVAFEPTEELNQKIDLAAEKIVELVESKPDGFVDFLFNLFTFYKDKFTNTGNDQGMYVIATLEAGLIKYLSHDTPMMGDDGEDGTMADHQTICENFGGVWLQEHNECENIGPKECDEVSGAYNECASACRHAPEGTFCTLQCVQVCEFPDEIVMNTKEVDLSKCATYFDGCNTCSVGEGGQMACTKKYCMEKEAPKCLQWKEPTKEDLKNCQTWFDGCNNCTVENGSLGACTEMACMELKEPKCVKFADMEY